MKDLLLKLANAYGPAGSETHIRETLKEMIAPYTDDLQIDVLGNLIGYKKGSGIERKTIILEANMDEPGIMAIHIEEKGFVRLAGIGDLNPASLIGERVYFAADSCGVIGADSGKALKDITFSDLFVDLGVESREQAEMLLKVGSIGTIDRQAFVLGEHKIVGRALDNRAGCAVLADALSKLPSLPHDVFAIFAVQKTVGSRGIKAAAFQTGGDIAFVAGTAKAGDTPKPERSTLRLGAGPAIKVMDKGIVIPPAVKQKLVETAKSAGIPYQLEVSPDLGSDAGQILLSRDGIPTGAVTIPLRYAQTNSQMVDIRDVQLASDLLVEAVRNYF